MPDLPSRSDLFRVAMAEALSQNSQLSVAEINRPGSDANIFLAAGVGVAEECIAQLAAARAASNYGTAKAEKLRRLVMDRTNGAVTPKSAAPALTSVSFASAAGAPGAFQIPQATQLQTPNGQQFITLAAANFPSSSNGPIVVPVRSVLAGADQQVPANQITAITSTIAGAAPDLTVSNPLASFGADDAEQDAQYVLRAQQFFVNARRGTLGAIATGALAVAGVRTAATFEYVDTVGNPARAVQLVIADAYTDALAVLSNPPASYATQSASIATAIQTGLVDYRCGGIPVIIYVAQVVMLQVNLALAIATTFDPVATSAAAQAAVVNYINNLVPGQSVTLAGLAGALLLVPGLVITGNGTDMILSPRSSIVPTPLQVIRTTAALVGVG